MAKYPLLFGVLFVSWSTMMMHLVLHLSLLNFLVPKSIIQTLPGFSGTLPFNLETGYVSVRNSGEVELFYYFIESENVPDTDPLVLWLSGGPGCSAFNILTFENGPLHFDSSFPRDRLPTFIRNPYSWTKIANTIYLDAPAGTGFSYATTEGAWNSCDFSLVRDVHEFIRKWLIDHPRFMRNPFYLAGESYSGIPLPMLALEISYGNEAGNFPNVFLQGYLLGNAATDQKDERNSRIKYAYRMGLISEEYYKSVKIWCNGDYSYHNPNNVCTKYLRLIHECLDKVKPGHILEPICPQQRASFMDIFSPSQQEEQDYLCRNFKFYILADLWMRYPNVLKHLHIREGTTRNWVLCNKSLSFTSKVFNVVEYHRLLSKNKYRVLVYSGDHDSTVPYFSTLSWIHNLNLTVDEKWRPWFVHDQVAGFTEKYKKDGFGLTFATVKGAGHLVSEAKPRESFAMVKRWLNDCPL